MPIKIEKDPQQEKPSFEDLPPTSQSSYQTYNPVTPTSSLDFEKLWQKVIKTFGFSKEKPGSKLLQTETNLFEEKSPILQEGNCHSTKQQGCQRADVEKILVQGRGSRSHFYTHRLRPSFKNFESGSGYSSNLRIRLLFRLRLQSSFQP